MKTQKTLQEVIKGTLNNGKEVSLFNRVILVCVGLLLDRVQPNGKIATWLNEFLIGFAVGQMAKNDLKSTCNLLKIDFKKAVYWNTFRSTPIIATLTALLCGGPSMMSGLLDVFSANNTVDSVSTILLWLISWPVLTIVWSLIRSWICHLTKGEIILPDLGILPLILNSPSYLRSVKSFIRRKFK